MARGRKPGFQMSEEHRVKIQNSNILNALVEHVEGKREMSASQVNAGIALMRKVLPDLTSAEVNASVEHTFVAQMPARAETQDEWSKIYSPPSLPSFGDPDQSPRKH